MNCAKETLTSSSLNELRILCKLPQNSFACFEIPDPNNLLSALCAASDAMENEGTNTDCVMIPIECILTKSFHTGFLLSRETEWAKYIKGYGLFTNASIVFYNTKQFANIEL